MDSWQEYTISHTSATHDHDDNVSSYLISSPNFGINMKQSVVIDGVSVFTCTWCSYSTSKKGNLAQHLLTHTGEKPFACPYCTYRCAAKALLKEHIRRHTGEKPLTCSHCSFTTAYRATLHRHLKTHKL